VKDLSEIIEIIDKKIDDLNYPKSPNLLYDPIKYIMGMQCKRMRPILVLMSFQLFDENLDKAIPAALAIEIFHNFTLLHDDIMDNAPIRRGSPTVHKKWNKNTAILSGDVMMIQAYQLLEKLDNNKLGEVLNIFSKTAVEVCEGQQLDMHYETQENVDLISYLKMIEYKTAVLLAASLQIGAIIAGANKNQQKQLYQFGINIGIAFQLKDDLLDAFGNSEDFGKQIGGDILENKKTFLYLKALDLSDESTKEKLKVFYKDNNKSKEKIHKVIDIFKRLNIKHHTIELMKAYYTKAMKHLQNIDSDNKECLILFSDKLMDRVS
jgi:geranylgeranyl diphosphate synthase type II